MLSRLAELTQFQDQSGWIYFAIDEDDKLDEIARLTRRLGMSRRVEPISLSVSTRLGRVKVHASWCSAETFCTN